MSPPPLQSFDRVQAPVRMNALVACYDLTGFHRMMERRSAAFVFGLMADWMEWVGDQVEPHGGRVVKFIGDAALILFPGNRAPRAIPALHRLQVEGDRWLARRRIPCRMRVSVHWGPVVVGRMGTRSEKRLDVYGLTVNRLFRMRSEGFL